MSVTETLAARVEALCGDLARIRTRVGAAMVSRALTEAISEATGA